MLYSILVRTLKEDVEFEQFREAWLPDPVEDGIEFRVVNARNLANPREIVSIGIMDLEPDQVEALMSRTEEHNARRHNRIEPPLEGERVFLGAFQELSDDAIAL